MNLGEYAQRSATMKTDVKELDDSYELAIDLPGVNKEDVSAELKDGYLVVNATQNSEKNENDADGKYIFRERHCGTTTRSFYVGKQVKQEDIKAKFENGILKLVVPKEQPAVEASNYIAIE